MSHGRYENVNVYMQMYKYFLLQETLNVALMDTCAWNLYSRECINERF